MVLVSCKICAKTFKVKPYALKQGFGKYCSISCLRKGQMNGKNVSCFVCGKQIYRTEKQLRCSKSNKYFCGKVCQTSWRNKFYVGSKHANFVDGKFTHRTTMLRTGAPQICRLCLTIDRRVLAVHHIDENHLNNAVENLAWLCHNCHFLVHHDKLEKKKFMATMV